jgi:hypothetical protein
MLSPFAAEVKNIFGCVLPSAGTVCGGGRVG